MPAKGKLLRTCGTCGAMYPDGGVCPKQRHHQRQARVAASAPVVKPGRAMRACTGCGRPLEVGATCPACRITPGARQQPRKQPRASNVVRGYDHRHRKLREALVAVALATGQRCELCGEAMLAGQALDLDHGDVPARAGGVGTRVVHATCNRRQGGLLAQALREQDRLVRRQ
jgi:hypothetical protein